MDNHSEDNYRMAKRVECCGTCGYSSSNVAGFIQCGKRGNSDMEWDIDCLGICDRFYWKGGNTVENEAKKDWVVEFDEIKKDTPSGDMRMVVVFGRLGHRCGYVGVTKNHILFGKDYDEAGLDVDVHGGLTYAGWREGYPVESDKKEWWWFGFDCMHLGDKMDIGSMLKYGMADNEQMSLYYRYNLLGDSGTARSLDYVADECRKLAKQLANIHPD